MELEPWLAESYENVDELTWKINLKDGITFTSGRKLDGEAVKECIEHLVAVHKRAAGDLNIERVEAEADTVIITSRCQHLLIIFLTLMAVLLICRQELLMRVMYQRQDLI